MITLPHLRRLQKDIRRAGDQFSDREAWYLFRAAAFGEAIGWSLLITGIALSRYVFHGNRDSITIGGQLHGTLFLLYIAASIVFSVRLRWSLWQLLVALIASVVPYGSLLFEYYYAQVRQRRLARTYISLQTLRFFQEK